MKNKKQYELDIRSGSFCIYSIDTGRVMCAGELDMFNSYEEMHDYAKRKFKELEK